MPAIVASNTKVPLVKPASGGFIVLISRFQHHDLSSAVNVDDFVTVVTVDALLVEEPVSTTRLTLYQ
jgi:hypothetical protein